MSPRQRLTFGRYRLDPDNVQLWYGKRLVRLTRKAFDVLYLLASHPGQLVTKDALLAAVWPEVVVTESAVTKRIQEVRRALRDTPQAPRYIETVHRQGCRFLGTVSAQPVCGQALGDTLPAADMPPAAGQPVALPPATPVAAPHVPQHEYKPVTVLGCTLPEASTLATILGAEGMYHLVQGLFTQAQDILHRYGGTIIRYGGDGFTALFGAPVAQEDHARRAVLAALDLQRHWRGHHTVGDVVSREAVALCLGAHSGTVLVGTLEHEPRRLCAAVDETTHLASRLQQMAPPGALLVSDATYRLIQTEVRVVAWGVLHTSEALPAMPMYAVQEITRQRAGVPIRSAQSLSYFIGRGRELAILRERLEQAANGRGQVVSIVGDPGIGKSRLLGEIRQRLGGDQVLYRDGRCLSYGQYIPYGPVLSLLRCLCGIGDADDAATIADKLCQGLHAAAMAPEEWAPLLYQLFGIAQGTDPLAALSPEALRQRTFTALRQLSLAESRHHTLMLAIEDLHWSDKTSETFFTSLVDSLAGAAVLFVTTFRPGYRPPRSEKSYVTQLALQRLSPRDSLRVVQSVCQTMSLPAAVVQEILTKAEGNPFFLEELTRNAMEQHGARRSLTVPESIHGVLMARIDQLSETPRRLLQTAAILGRDVPLWLLVALWDGTNNVADLMWELHHAEFLYEQIGAPEPVYRFKHALLQEVAYTSMAHTRCQALHTAAGGALEARYQGRLEAIIAQLAYHYSRSTDASKAVRYLTHFGIRAAKNYAHVEALTIYQEAQRHIAHLPETEREHRRLELILLQARSLFILARFQEARDVLLSCQPLFEHLQEPMLLGQHAVRLGLTYLNMGQHQHAVQYAQKALVAARQCQDTVTMGQAYYLLAAERSLANQFAEVITYGQQAVDLLQASEEYHSLGLTHWLLGRCAGFLGAFDQALAAAAQAYAIGEATADLRLQCAADTVTGWVYVMQGEWQAGIAVCQRALDHASDPFTTTGARAHLGIAYLAQGDVSQAIALLQQAVEQYRQLQYKPFQGRYAAYLSEALLADKQYAQAYQAAYEGLEVSQQAHYPYGVGLAQRALGRLAQTEVDYEAAVQYLHKAVETFNAIQVQYEVARTHLCLAEIAQLQGDRHALSTHLHNAHHLFTSLRVPQYVERTERLARQCGISLLREPCC